MCVDSHAGFEDFSAGAMSSNVSAVSIYARDTPARSELLALGICPRLAGADIDRPGRDEAMTAKPCYQQGFF
jgi:hypothetical protein